MPLLSRKRVGFIITVFFVFLVFFGISAEAEEDGNATAEKFVVPGGQSVGVSLDLSGVYVDGLGDVETEGGASASPAKSAGIVSGDIITAINDDPVKTVDDFRKKLNTLEDTEEVKVTLKTSQGTEETKSVVPVRASEDGSMKIGVWVKDAASGVGTITYYDPQTKEFAAVGHSISNVNAGIASGEITGDIFKSEIVGVRRGESGTPGELIGVYSENKLKIGAISQSNEFGIVGTVPNPENLNSMRQPIPIGGRDSVSLGEAIICSNVEGTKIQEFTIEIVEINQNSDCGKDIVFKVTDESLIQKTGGIVRGMSGSPIIQNDKIIGSVTHVLVNEPTMGYGIFIENMQK